MTLKEFITHFDYEGAIILLEGKRKVPESDRNKLIAFGKLLASNTSKMKFRSGNAKGSDEYFSMGVSSVDSARLEVIVPYTNHRKKSNKAYTSYSLEDINLSEEPDIIYHSKQHKSMTRLIDNYLQGKRDKYSVKAAYIIRDTVKVTGTKKILPATFGIFYDDLNSPKTGGTGHTMNVCINNDIQAIDQSVWFNWLQTP